MIKTLLDNLTGEQFDSLVAARDKKISRILKRGGAFQMTNWSDCVNYLKVRRIAQEAPICIVKSTGKDGAYVWAIWTGGGREAFIPNEVIKRQISLPWTFVIWCNFKNVIRRFVCHPNTR